MINPMLLVSDRLMVGSAVMPCSTIRKLALHALQHTYCYSLVEPNLSTERLRIRMPTGGLANEPIGCPFDSSWKSVLARQDSSSLGIAA